MTANQNRLATHLIVASHDTLHRFADSVGVPKVPVTIINNMGRCGSTLVCQILQEVPGLRVISEPWSLLHAQYLHHSGRLDTQHYHTLIVSLLLLQCKCDDPAVTQIAIKLQFPSMAHISLIKSQLPSLRQIFLFRDPRASIASMYKVNHVLAANMGMEEFLDLWAHTIPLPHCLPEENYRFLIHTGQMSLGRITALKMLCTLRQARDFVCKHGDFLEVCTYEELMTEEDKVQSFLGLFALKEGEKIVSSDKCLKADSQGTTAISRDNLKKQEIQGMADMEEMEELAALLGIPSVTASLDTIRNYIRTGERV